MSDMVKVIFQKAADMEVGDRIPLRFNSAAQRDSFRVRFYNERKKYAEIFGQLTADAIMCRKETIKGQFILIIEKSLPMQAPFVLKSNGTKEDISFIEDIPMQIPDSEVYVVADLGHGRETPEERIERLMKEANENEN